MHCGACVKRVERALGQIPGVTSAKVNLIAGRAKVSYDPAQANEDALREAVRGAGFGA
jgi:copper chaperone CopZ